MKMWELETLRLKVGAALATKPAMREQMTSRVNDILARVTGKGLTEADNVPVNIENSFDMIAAGIVRYVQTAPTKACTACSVFHEADKGNGGNRERIRELLEKLKN